MKRVRSSLPSYRKHRPTGQAVVTLSGHDFYLGPHGTAASRHEYDRLIAEWLANGRRSLVATACDLTVTDLALQYLRHAKGYYRKDGRPTGEIGNIKAAIRAVKQLYGHTLAIEFGPLALKAVRQHLIQTGCARTTVNQAVGRIKRMFKWGVGEELIPEAVHASLTAVDGLRRGKTEAAETRPVLPVSAADIEATIAHLPAVVADMVRVQRVTGMRPGEVCIMRPADIDRSGDVWLYRPESHKTEHFGRQRVVCVGPQAQEVLLRYLARDAQAYCFQPRDSEAKRLADRHANRSTPLSCGNRPGTNRKTQPKRRAGDCYTPNTYRRAIDRACEKAGIEAWTPNRLRHTAATEIRKRFGLEAAQVILGHSQAKVTEVYAERDLAKAIEVAREVG